eukprot:s1951_g9.t1
MTGIFGELHDFIALLTPMLCFTAARDCRDCEDGLLTSCADYSRALQRFYPKLFIYDLEEMGPDLRARAVEELRQLDADGTLKRSAAPFQWLRALAFAPH